MGGSGYSGKRRGGAETSRTWVDEGRRLNVVSARAWVSLVGSARINDETQGSMSRSQAVWGARACGRVDEPA